MTKLPNNKIAFVLGARPTAIKLAPVYIEAKARGLNPIIISTGQHRELVHTALSVFDLKPDYDLHIMTKKQSLSQITARILHKLPPLLEKLKPDMLVVQGDTPSDFTASLVSYYLKIPLAHIEAGLRSYNKYHPFPEEIARKTIDSIADLHFAPTKCAKQQLQKENYLKASIHITGNTGIDALYLIMKKLKIKRTQRKYHLPINILLTTHRRESWDNHIAEIFKALSYISKKYQVKITFPVHPNPLITNLVDKIFSNQPNFNRLPPIDYIDMVKLMSNTDLIITDSGGIQEEATYLGIPTLVVREVTERPEGVTVGVLKVIGRRKQNIIDNTYELISNQKTYESMAKPSDVYGNGQASIEIISTIKRYLEKYA